MNITIRFAVLVQLLALIAYLSSNVEGQKNVLDILNTNYSIFAGLVLNNSASLTARFNGSQLTTVFAPTNAAITAAMNLPSGNLLVQLLEYHVVRAFASINSSQLTNGQVIDTVLQLETLGNNSQVSTVMFSGTGANTTISINGVANVTAPNQEATNGIVHGIDAVLVPVNYNTSGLVNMKFVSLYGLLGLAKLTNAVSGPALTLFAPTQNAIAGLPSPLTTYLTINSTASLADLTNILTYHVAPALYYAGNLNNGTSTVTTLNGGTVTVTKPYDWPNSRIYLNDNSQDTVSQPDLITTSGVVHGIDSVLIPQNFNFTLSKILVGGGVTDFIAAINNTNTSSILLDDTLPRTILAPANSANFSSLDKNGVLYHGISQQILTTSLTDGELVSSLVFLPTLGNRPQQLKFTKFANASSGWAVNGIAISQRDIQTINTPESNVVQFIESPLMLPGLVPSVASANGLDKLAFAASLSIASDLVLANLTVFAPTDAAFSKLPNGTFEYLVSNTSKSIDDLGNVLRNHIVQNSGAIFYSHSIPIGTTNLTNINNATLTVSKTFNSNTTTTSVTVNGANVIIADVLAANGVVHVIDTVLVPKTVQISLLDVLEGLGTFTHLINFLQSANLSFFLNGSHPVTIFAPDDDAFERVDLQNLENNSTQLIHVLQSHVIAENIMMLN